MEVLADVPNNNMSCCILILSQTTYVPTYLRLLVLILHFRLAPCSLFFYIRETSWRMADLLSAESIQGETFDDKLDSIASLLASKKYIIALVGAGISTSAGIPDFRSATGLYNTLNHQVSSGDLSSQKMCGMHSSIIDRPPSRRSSVSQARKISSTLRRSAMTRVRSSNSRILSTPGQSSLRRRIIFWQTWIDSESS